jgi:predicted metal-binding protein
MTAIRDGAPSGSVHRLIVCTTCRREGAPEEAPSDGGKLFEAIQALFSASPDRRDCAVTGVECMSGCNRSCTIGLAAPGKPSYLFGGLPPTAETAADALALARQYRDSVDGVLERRSRPPSFRKGILARIPAAFEL